jgi:phosphate transport system protein
MGDHIVRAYDQALDHLASDLAKMGGLAESQVNDAISAITRRDTALAQTVIQRDAKIDAAQKEVEKRCTSLLALRQPMANDLREVMAAWKISSDLERVGDLAKNIAKRTLVINQSDPIQLTKSIERMGRLAAAHLKQVLDAYSSREVAPALAIWFQDEDIDAHYNSLFRELLTYMMEDPRTIGPCAHLLFVAKNIERIGDHSTNIAETLHYLVTGEEIATERPKADDERAVDVR